MGLPLRQAIREVDDIRKRLKREIRKAEHKTALDAFQDALNHSSGKKSLGQLRKEDHPYAVRNPHPGQDAAIINEQTGDWKRGWKTILGDWNGDQLTTRIINTDEKWKLLEGERDNILSAPDSKRTMIIRPIRRRIVERLRPKRIKNLQRAINRSLK